MNILLIVEGLGRYWKNNYVVFENLLVDLWRFLKGYMKPQLGRTRSSSSIVCSFFLSFLQHFLPFLLHVSIYLSRTDRLQI